MKFHFLLTFNHNHEISHDLPHMSLIPHVIFYICLLTAHWVPLLYMYTYIFFFYSRDLVERANTWLLQTPQYRVKNCETVTWWTTDPIHVGDTEAVLLEQGVHVHSIDDTTYLVGLRYVLLDYPPLRYVILDYLPRRSQVCSIDDTTYLVGLRYVLLDYPPLRYVILDYLPRRSQVCSIDDTTYLVGLRYVLLDYLPLRYVLLDYLPHRSQVCSIRLPTSLVSGIGM